MVVQRHNRSLVEMYDPYACPISVGPPQMERVGVTVLDATGKWRSWGAALETLRALLLRDGESLVFPIDCETVEIGVISVDGPPQSLTALDGSQAVVGSRDLRPGVAKEERYGFRGAGIRSMRFNGRRILVTGLCFTRGPKRKPVRPPPFVPGFVAVTPQILEPHLHLETGVAEALEHGWTLDSAKLGSDEVDVARAADKLGSDSGQVAEAAGKLLTDAVAVNELLGETQRSTLPAGDVDENGFVFDGRIVDSSGVGWDDVTVTALGDKDAVLSEVRTDNRGYYNIDVSHTPPAATGTAKPPSQGPSVLSARAGTEAPASPGLRAVRLEVTDAKSAVLHRDAAPIWVARGTRVRRELAVSSAGTRGPR